MEKPRFDHEKLDVYRVSIQFIRWSGHLLEVRLEECKLSVINQLDRSSTSIPLNIAEGNGKRSVKDRCRYLDNARGSALESAAALDILVSRGVLAPEDIDEGKTLLVRITGMLWKMIERLSEGDSRRG